MGDFCEAQLRRELLELFDFAVIEALRFMALAANDVMMVVGGLVELVERLARFGRNAGRDAGRLEGFEVSVYGDEIVLFGTEKGVSLFGSERFIGLDEDAEEGFPRLGDAVPLLFQGGYGGVEGVVGIAHFAARVTIGVWGDNPFSATMNGSEA